jgi:hypothetical protein
MLKYSLVITILFVSVFIHLNAQSEVKGIVYEDVNKNGKKDKNENGIKNIAVSNGIQVVLTNEKGEYTLPVQNDNIIFVIKPSTHSVPVNKQNLPQFFYIHKPKGSPELKYAGVSSTGKLPKSVDFGLFPSTYKENFTMLTFGDPQPYTKEEVDFFYKGIVKELEGVDGVDFGMSLGDLVGDDLDLFNPYINACSHIGIPWYNVIGNHDLNFDVKNDIYSDETYEKTFGPANFSFNHGMVHFIVLDDVLFPDPRDGVGYVGGFRKDQLEFVKNDLKHVPKDYLVVVSMHIPLTESQSSDTFRDEDRAKLFSYLKDFPYTLTLSAHHHTQSQYFLSREHGWQQEKEHHHYNVGTTSGDWYSGRLNKDGVPISTMRDGTPKGYAFIHYKKNQYVIDYKVAGKPKEYQIEIFAPKIVEQNRRTSSFIMANFFMGSENDSLFYRVDNGEWVKMGYIKTFDPSYLHLLHEWDYTEELLDGRRPSNPTESRHLWYGRVPVDLEVGEHTIEVKAHDMFGRVHKQTKKYRIAKK